MVPVDLRVDWCETPVYLYLQICNAVRNSRSPFAIRRLTGEADSEQPDALSKDQGQGGLVDSDTFQNVCR